MIEVETARFTVGVFQDVAWAVKGLDALSGAGFPPESLTVIAKEGADVTMLVERTFGSAGERLDIRFHRFQEEIGPSENYPPPRTLFFPSGMS